MLNLKEKILTIIDEEIRIESAINKIYDLDGWWWERFYSKKNDNNSIRCLKRLRKRIEKEC